MSGVAELACAVAVARPSTRRAGGPGRGGPVRGGVPRQHPDGRRLARPVRRRARRRVRPAAPPDPARALGVCESIAIRLARNGGNRQCPSHGARSRSPTSKPGDRVRHGLREFDVARIQSPFLGQTALVCLIEDTPTRWLRLSGRRHARDRGARGRLAPRAARREQRHVHLVGREAPVTRLAASARSATPGSTNATGLTRREHDAADATRHGSRRARAEHAHLEHLGARPHPRPIGELLPRPAEQLLAGLRVRVEIPEPAVAGHRRGQPR